MTESKKFVTNAQRLALEVSALLTDIGPARTGMVCADWCQTQREDANLPHDIECVNANNIAECSNGDCSQEAMARKTFANGLTAWLCRYCLAVGEPCAACGGGGAGVRIEVNGEDGGHTLLHLCYEHADRWSCELWVDDDNKCGQHAVYRNGLGYLRCRDHVLTPDYRI